MQPLNSKITPISGVIFVKTFAFTSDIDDKRGAIFYKVGKDIFTKFAI